MPPGVCRVRDDYDYCSDNSAINAVLAVLAVASFCTALIALLIYPHETRTLHHYVINASICAPARLHATWTGKHTPFNSVVGRSDNIRHLLVSKERQQQKVTVCRKLRMKTTTLTFVQIQPALEFNSAARKMNINNVLCSKTPRYLGCRCARKLFTKYDIQTSQNPALQKIVPGHHHPNQLIISHFNMSLEIALLLRQLRLTLCMCPEGNSVAQMSTL